MTNGNIDATRLVSIIERVERLEAEKKAIQSDISDIYAEAKSAGYEPKTIRDCIKLRAMDAATRQESGYLLDTYKNALGIE